MRCRENHTLENVAKLLAGCGVHVQEGLSLSEAPLRKE
jgi:hypothetical protein